MSQSPTSLVLSQPMLLPWRGLIEQALLCDIFIFYDDVQLPMGGGKGRSFETRVQIKTPEGWRWLSLPIDRSHSKTMLICEARMKGDDWRRSHLDILRQTYRKAPHFEATWNEVVLPIYNLETDLLGEFCIHGMKTIFAHLGITPRIEVSSQLHIAPEQKSSERVLAHCLAFEAPKYISGLGARNYIDYDLFERHGVKIHYMDYTLLPYPQLWGEFNPYVSILDLLFNTGPDAPKYLGSPAIYWKEMPDTLAPHTDTSISTEAPNS